MRQTKAQQAYLRAISRPVWFPMGPFWQIDVGVVYSQTAWIKATKGDPDTPDPSRWTGKAGCSAWRCEDKERTFIALDLAKLKLCSDPRLSGMVAHEAAHVVQFIAHYICERQFSDEAQAYLQGYVTEWALGVMPKNWRALA